jgi:iron complex transport system substrate-binding protein
MRLKVGLAVVAFALASCASSAPPIDRAAAGSNAGFPVRLDTSAGRISIDKEPTRIVSLSPTATEMLFAIGAGSQVVAVDDDSNYPPEAPTTKLSGFEPNVEAVAKYNPDLVVASDDSGGLGRGLRSIHIPLLVEPAARDLNDSYTQMTELGTATGHVGAAARVVSQMRARIQQIVASAPHLQGLTYYHELDNNYFTVTSKTFIGQIYALLGLKSIGDKADKNGSGYPQLSAEYIVNADPSVIFLADTKCCGQSAGTVAARPGWNQIAAVRNGAIVPLDDDIASRWGPRVVDLLQVAARKLSALDKAGAFK